jgi:hypothetical protein
MSGGCLFGLFSSFSSKQLNCGYFGEVLVCLEVVLVWVAGLLCT